MSRSFPFFWEDPSKSPIYTNDQFLHQSIKSCICTDTLAAQSDRFQMVESLFTDALEENGAYYGGKQLHRNSAKTQICAFRVRKKKVPWKPLTNWKGIHPNNCFALKYLGVTLDCSRTQAKLVGITFYETIEFYWVLETNCY